jgi:hypothetical protein
MGTKVKGQRRWYQGSRATRWLWVLGSETRETKD